MNQVLRVAVLGATGSIGRSAFAELSAFPDRFQAAGLVGCSRVNELAEEAAALHAPVVITADESRLDELRRAASPGCRALAGEQAILDLVVSDEVDVVLCAIIGTAGISPVLAALKAGKRVALASKEVLALAGELVMGPYGGRKLITPVDSEHSGVFQCLAGRSREEIACVWLTASGGAFRNWSSEEIARATYADALRHPTWNMGPKITVDSASLMNKALEVIEAHFLFDLPSEKLDVIVNPQSSVHALVELADGSFIAQVAVPDMRLPIRYALSYPQRFAGPVGKVRLSDLGRIELLELDHRRFPAIGLARQAIAAGGTMPAVLNAANEVAVDRFSRAEIPFPAIWEIVRRTMEHHTATPQESIGQLLEVDREARAYANALRI